MEILAVTVFSLISCLLMPASTQLPPYQAVPYNCGRICFPSDGYAVFFGITLCRCRSQLCDDKSCGPLRQCKVKSVWYGDIAECEQSPVTQTTPKPFLITTPPLSAAERCSRPPLTGMCRALIHRYYYDPAINACATFVYGGCDSNGNNFESLAECLSVCQPDTTGFFDGSNSGGSIGSSKSNDNDNDRSEKVQYSNDFLFRFWARKVGGNRPL